MAEYKYSLLFSVIQRRKGKSEPPALSEAPTLQFSLTARAKHEGPFPQQCWWGAPSTPCIKWDPRAAPLHPPFGHVLVFHHRSKYMTTRATGVLRWSHSSNLPEEKTLCFFWGCIFYFSRAFFVTILQSIFWSMWSWIWFICDPVYSTNKYLTKNTLQAHRCIYVYKNKLLLCNTFTFIVATYLSSWKSLISC